MLSPKMRTLLEKALEQYEGKKGENNLLSDLKRFKNDGFIREKEDFIRAVVWKSPRPKWRAQGNTPEKIQKISRTAFKLAREGKVPEAIEELTSLEGVGVRMATAILMFYDSSRFTVMDWLAWRSLVHVGRLDAFSCWFDDAATYPTYLKACKQLAKEFGHSLRDTDRALWQLADNEAG